MQKDGFGNAVKKMKGDQLIKIKPLMGLLPYVDEEGLLRFGGRLHRSNLPWERAHPIILPRRHHITRLIIKDIHHAFGHMGQQIVLSQAMRKYWIDLHNKTLDLQSCLFCKKRKSSGW